MRLRPTFALYLAVSALPLEGGEQPIGTLHLERNRFRRFALCALPNRDTADAFFAGKLLCSCRMSFLAESSSRLCRPPASFFPAGTSSTGFAAAYKLCAVWFLFLPCAARARRRRQSRCLPDNINIKALDAVQCCALYRIRGIVGSNRNYLRNGASTIALNESQ